MQMLGSDYCNTPVSADLLPGDIQQLTAREMDALWRLFQEIGRTWECTNSDSINIMSDWREFVHLLKSPRGDVAVLLATFLLTPALMFVLLHVVQWYKARTDAPEHYCL